MLLRPKSNTFAKIIVFIANDNKRTTVNVKHVLLTKTVVGVLEIKKINAEMN